MDLQELQIPDVKILRPRRFSDERGFYSETYNQRVLAECGIELDFVQDNHVFSSKRGTLRGLHFQKPPYAEHKLLRVSRGRVLDVAVDLRMGSPSYGQHVVAELSADEFNQILVPAGFAHGFVTMEPDTEVLYKVTAHYSPENTGGLIWNDPDLGIDWPIPGSEVILSAKDKAQPKFRTFRSPFTS